MYIRGLVFLQIETTFLRIYINNIIFEVFYSFRYAAWNMFMATFVFVINNAWSSLGTKQRKFVTENKLNRIV